MVAPEAVASEAVAASSSSTGLYDFFPTARAAFTGIYVLIIRYMGRIVGPVACFVRLRYSGLQAVRSIYYPPSGLV